jgi:hypothetical protein
MKQMLAYLATGDILCLGAVEQCMEAGAMTDYLGKLTVE